MKLKEIQHWNYEVQYALKYVDHGDSEKMRDLLLQVADIQDHILDWLITIAAETETV